MRIKAIVISFFVIALAATTVISHFTNNDGHYTPRNDKNQRAEGIMGGDAYFREVRANVNTGEFDPNDVLTAQKKLPKRTGKKSNLGLSWESMGPIDVGGRIRDFLIDNQNPDRYITGGVSGGLFVSNNKGLRWEMIEGLPNLIVSTMDQGPNGTIYVGTGSRFEGSASMPGTGIYKSTDGINYEVLEATKPSSYTAPSNNNPWPYVNRLAVDPTDDDIVYAGTNQGLFRTADGGQTWTKVFSQDCQITGTGVDDVKVLPSGRVIVGARSGVYYSDNPSVPCDWTLSSNFSGAGRIALAFCQSDPEYVYAITVTQGGFFEQGGQLENIYKSTDGGSTWEVNLPRVPTETQDPSFSLFGQNGQGIYDLAIEVFPNNCENLMIGGVQLYRIQSAWARVASTFASKQSGIYVHADKHYFKFNPNNPGQLFVASDGGIGVTNNAASAQPQFSTLNRNLITTQFYDIDVSSDGRVAGGTQDNGSIMLDPSRPSSSGREEIRLMGGDGFGTKFSTLGDIVFTTLYFNKVTKITLPNISNAFFESTNSFDADSPYAGDGKAPFRSVIDIWETESDTLSRDSITFTADTVEQVLATLSSSDVAYSGTIEPSQPAAKIIPGSIRFRNPSPNRIQTFSDSDADGTLYDQLGDSIGFYNYETREFQIRFPNTPSEQSDLFVYYAQRFEPGDTLRLRSRTLSYPFSAPLQVALNPGDSIRVQDPVQSLFAMVYNDGVVLTREALKKAIPESTDYIDLSNVVTLSGIREIDFSPDGDQLFVGTGGGQVWRFTGLRQLFADNTDTPENVVSAQQIFNTSGPIEGLSAHPEDLDKMLVSVAGYGNTNHIFELTGIRAGGNATSRNLQGNMEDFPVYDALYDMNNPSTVLLGTDFGIWSTDDVNASNVVWEQENELIGRVPVFTLLQQTLPPSEANNTGVIYVGTHGRGIWKTGDLVSSVPEFAEFDKPENMDLKIYPNPVSYQATIEFNSIDENNNPVTINIYDLNGKLVRTFRNRSNEAGKNTLRFNAGDLPNGNYIATVSSGDKYNTTRFVVMR